MTVEELLSSLDLMKSHSESKSIDFESSALLRMFDSGCSVACGAAIFLVKEFLRSNGFIPSGE